jgi:hypothetical protein
MRIAHHPQTEAEGQIENLKDLREVIEAGDTKLALDWIDVAIKLLASDGARPPENSTALSKL